MAGFPNPKAVKRNVGGEKVGDDIGDAFRKGYDMMTSAAGKNSRASRGLGSAAEAAPAAPKPKKAAKAPMTGWEAKVTPASAAKKPKSSSYSQSRSELGDFYLNATSGMFSDKAGGKKK